MKPQRVEISYKTIIFTFAFLAAVGLLWSIRSILATFFLCFIFMEAINPTVNKIQKLKLPRAVAIIIIYLGILAVVSFAFAGIIPIFVEQSKALVSSLPGTINNINLFGISASSIDWNSQFKILENLPAEIAKTVVSLFSNVLSLFVFFVITFYLLLERKNFGKYAQKIWGINGKKKVVNIVNDLEIRLGSWVNAEIFLMTIIGVLSYIAYSLIGLNYSVPLAIVAGLLEIVPTLGPTVATVLAGIVGLTVSPLVALLAIISGIIIQQLENNFIVPKIMKETVGLNPIVTIFLIAVGAKLAGVVGAVLAIPIYLTIETILKVLTGKDI